MPFELGFHQWISREPAPGTPSGIHGARLKLDRDQITAGNYRLYEHLVLVDRIILVKKIANQFQTP